MDMISAVPEWLVWCTAAGAAVFGLAAVVNTIEAALDLEV